MNKYNKYPKQQSSKNVRLVQMFRKLRNQPLIRSSTVTQYLAVCDLGIYIDYGLTMQSHVRQTAYRCFAVLRQLRTVRRQVPTSVFQSLIAALVLSRLDYCNSVLFGLPANLIQRLQSVQNAAARLIFRIRRSEHITPVLIAFTGYASQNVSPSN